MRKTIIFLIISLMILAIMACGLGSSVLNESRSPTTDNMHSEIFTTNKTLPPGADETLPINESEQSNLIENSPTPTTDPISSAKKCLSKTWEIEGLSDYVVAAVPPELAEEYNLQYEDTTGQAYLSLSDDDRVVLQADDLEINFKARVTIFEVPIKVRIDGTANGTYDIDDTKLRMNNMDTAGLTASARALDEDIIDQEQIIKSIPFIKAPYNTAEYSCQDGRLELEMSGYPEDIPPLIFRAVE